jgi:hypothetical protein
MRTIVAQRARLTHQYFVAAPQKEFINSICQEPTSSAVATRTLYLHCGSILVEARERL